MTVRSIALAYLVMLRTDNTFLRLPQRVRGVSRPQVGIARLGEKARDGVGRGESVDITHLLLRQGKARHGEGAVPQAACARAVCTTCRDAESELGRWPGAYGVTVLDIPAHRYLRR